jgi:hypothetical protein
MVPAAGDFDQICTIWMNAFKDYTFEWKTETKVRIPTEAGSLVYCESELTLSQRFDTPSLRNRELALNNLFERWYPAAHDLHEIPIEDEFARLRDILRDMRRISDGCGEASSSPIEEIQEQFKVVLYLLWSNRRNITECLLTSLCCPTGPWLSNSSL